MLAPRILVVEDESAKANDLREQLMHLGYEVSYLVATDDRALDTIEQSRPDLILMDIKTHGELGDTALASAIPASDRTPVVLLTASQDAHGDPPAAMAKPEQHRVIQVTFARRHAEPRRPGETRAPRQVTDELSRVVWRKSHDSLFASIASNETSVRYHLIVERLPRKLWDWAVWRSGDTAETARHGRASSSDGAMAAAEAMAGEMRDIEAARNRPRRLARG